MAVFVRVRISAWTGLDSVPKTSVREDPGFYMNNEYGLGLEEGKEVVSSEVGPVFAALEFECLKLAWRCSTTPPALFFQDGVSGTILQDWLLTAIFLISAS
jgi:hypothetical protein